MFLTHALQVGAGGPPEGFERKKQVFFKTCFHTRSMAQTIFSDEYYLPGTPETKNPGAPTTGTTTSIRSN